MQEQCVPGLSSGGEEGPGDEANQTVATIYPGS